ncbi:type II secretion system protein J [Sulfurimonas sp. CS5]|uniref:PulJ/GspJ family protein n=1 Tax=Sulfurimonas sp. CS5 TaxID=3391145 RepID=UPI0039EAEA05
MRRGFTLIEMLISVTILSIMMLFLYKSYSSLNHSNSFYKKEVNSLEHMHLIKKVIFLDFSLAIKESITILNQKKVEDVVFMQSSNSLHKRYNPYITYIMKNSKLYRLESLKPLTYPLRKDSKFSVDYIGEVDSFRVFKSEKEIANLFLVHVDFKNEDNILLKIKVLEGS